MRLLGLPKVPSQALEDGNLLHRCLEEYAQLPEARWLAAWNPHVRDGMTPEQTRRAKTARLAMAMWPLRTPGHDVAVEPTWFLELPELETAVYIKPDRLIGAREGGGRAFDDWKSTGAPHQLAPYILQQRDWWPKGSPEWVKLIERDIQANLYAHGICERFGLEGVHARWIYGSKKFAFSRGAAPKVWRCEHYFTAAAARDFCERYIWPVVQVMNALRFAWKRGMLDSPLLVPHCPSACDFTGRFCDAVAHCDMHYESPVKLHLPLLPKGSEP